MPKATRICKICGKEYEYCLSLKPKENTFVWQDVACCPEHGSLYFARILESRGMNPADYGFADVDKDKKEEKKTEVKQPEESIPTPKKDYIPKSKKKHSR